MAINKVVYNNNALIDLTDTTAVAEHVVSGDKFYLANGNSATGTLVIQKYYTGSSTPSSSLGNNGDIYLKTV